MTTTLLSDTEQSAKSVTEGSFQVHVLGLLDAVYRPSVNHGLQVFLRELLQSAADSISRWDDPFAEQSRIDVEVMQCDGDTTILIEDNGVGMTVEDASSRLAMIGLPCTREPSGVALDTPCPLGLGILSGFLVADEIRVISRSRVAGASAFWWKGTIDGAWSQGVMEDHIAPGTKVYLRLRSEHAVLFTPDEVRRLVKRYAGWLSVPVYLCSGGDEAALITGRSAPWDITAGGGEASLISAAAPFFSIVPMGAFAFESHSTGMRGVAWIESDPTLRGEDRGHWLYVKGMLVGDRVRGLVPSHLPFLRVVINDAALRLKAGRGSLDVEASRLESLHADIAESLDQYLMKLCEHQPGRASAFVTQQIAHLVHAAEESGQFLGLLSRHYLLETSLGKLTVDEIQRRHGRIEFVESEADYFRCETRAHSEGVCIIRATCPSALQFLHALERDQPQHGIVAVTASELLARFAPPCTPSTDREANLITLIENELHIEQCIGGLTDGDDPFEAATLVLDECDNAVRMVANWHGISATFGTAVAVLQKRLLLNRNHRVVEHWLTSRALDTTSIRRWVRVFYHGALLASRERPTPGELRRYSGAIEDLAIQQDL